MADQTIESTPFVNLHVHSEYSVLDGLAHPEDLARRAKELGQTAIAVTDHGTLSGVIPFIRACRDEGIKPIVGCELYVTAGDRRARPKKGDDDFEITDPTYHLVVLAQNATGYRNLIKLSSMAYLEGFRRKPRVDHALLEQYNEGLFVLSGCLGGELAKALTAGDEDRAREVIEFYKNTFPGRYALEVQNHSIDDEDLVRQALIQLSRQYDLPLVATADNHFVHKEQAAIHELWLCAQTGSTMADPSRFRFDGHGYHLASAAEMMSLFPDAPEAVENAQMIADLCAFEFPTGDVQLPNFPHMDPGSTSSQMLRRLCEEGVQKRYGDQLTQEILDRMNMELDVIDKAGFPDYFLIVWDLIHHAKEADIKVAPGRGSAAGSVVSYALGITSLDPIENDLLFERFLNPERVSMPDIDIDFEDRRRGEMIEYARETYGHDKVAQIITISKLGPKDACRRVAKARGVEFADALMLTKLIPETAESLDEAFKMSSELTSFVGNTPWAQQIIKDATQLVGYVSGSSINAAGVVVTRDPLLDAIPLQHPSGAEHADAIISQFDKDILGDLNFLKIDFLGNNNLSIVKDALKMVAEEYGLDIEMEQIPPGDSATMSMLAQGDTVGVFQMEGRGASAILRDMNPRTLGDIAAANALNRPGPLQGIVEEAHVESIFDPQTNQEELKRIPAKTVVAAYMERRRHPERIEAPIPEVHDLLLETNGLILYQDQVMQIAHQVAGYSLGEADILRAAMGKKNLEKMAHEHEKFIKGAVANGVAEDNAQKLWDYIDKFAGYGFNKAHAYAYGQLAYYTAWVKCHYPLEFTTALCNSRGGTFEAAKDSNKMKRGTIESAIRDAKAHGITVVNPDVNQSEVNFSIRSRVRQTISYGLAHVKKVGIAPAEAIVSERKAHGQYTSFADLVERNQVSGLSMGAVRMLWKKPKTAADFATLDDMLEAGVLRDDEIETARKAIAERDANGPYKSFAQVLERNDLRAGTNSGTWEALIRSGACDEFGARHDLLKSLPDVLKNVTKLKTTEGLQMDLMAGQERRRQLSAQENPKVLTIQDLDEEEKYLGVSLSGHRMDAYQQELAQRGVMTVEQVMSASKLPPRFRIAGLLKSKRITYTKKGHKPMAILKLEDATGEFDALVFEAYLDDMHKALDVGSGPVLIRGDRLTGGARDQDQERLAIRVQQVSRLEEPAVQKDVAPPSLEIELLSPDEDALALA